MSVATQSRARKLHRHVLTMQGVWSRLVEECGAEAVFEHVQVAVFEHVQVELGASCAVP